MENFNWEEEKRQYMKRIRHIQETQPQGDQRGWRKNQLWRGTWKMSLALSPKERQRIWVKMLLVVDVVIEAWTISLSDTRSKLNKLPNNFSLLDIDSKDEKFIWLFPESSMLEILISCYSWPLLIKNCLQWAY